MLYRILGGVLLVSAWGLVAPGTSQGLVVINEIFADPAATLAGDANNDGISSSANDEFVELLNYGDTSVDLSGWSIRDAISPRHVFPIGTTLTPYQYLVIFGGGNPNLPGINWQKASTGTLSLNNTSETITLLNAQAQVIDQIIYGSLANNDQSIVRSPEGSGQTFVLHSGVPQAGGRLFSPGTNVSGQPFSSTAVPETDTLPALGLGLAFLSFALSRRHLFP